MGSALLPARGCRPGGRVWAPVWHGRTVLAPSTWSPGHALEDLSLRERTLWRMHCETAARSARGARARRRGRGPGRTGRPGSGKIGGIDVIIWRTGTARLLPRLLKGRKSGPVVITERKARVQLPATSLGPRGRARLSYQQAAALFSGASGGATLAPAPALRAHLRRRGRHRDAAADGALRPHVGPVAGQVRASLGRGARPPPGRARPGTTPVTTEP